MLHHNQPISNIDNLFLSLRQLQINLIKTTSKQSINDYFNQLKSIFENEQKIPTNQESNSLIHFLIFPVLVTLKQRQELNTRDWSDLNELLINCINITLDKIKLSDLNIFSETLNVCSLVLSKRMNQSANLVISDEFYLASFKLITNLFETNLLESFYQFKNITSIGLLVSIFLDLILQSNSIEVRLGALESLKSISSFKSSEFRPQIGIIFPSFLPGILIKLIQAFLLAQNLKLLNHKLICKSLEVLSHVISCVFSDSLLDETYSVKCYNGCLSTDQILPDNVKALIINRTENKEWLKDSSDKVFSLIRPLLNELLINDNSNVHSSLVNFCSNISKECYYSLNEQLPVLLKVLASFATNTLDLKLAQTATDALTLMGHKESQLDKQTGQFIIQNKFSIMQTCIEELLLKLPRIMSENDSNNNNLEESYRLSHLKTLYGYLNLIGTGNYSQSSICLREFLYSNLENLNKLLMALITCVSFDYKSLDNFYQLSNEMDSSVTLSNYIGLQTYLSDKHFYEQLCLICDYLGRSDAARLIIDELLTNNLVYLQQKQTKCEIMFLVNLILKGVCSAAKQNSKEILNLTLSTFINEFKTDSVELIEPLTLDSIATTTDRNRKIIQKCLTIEAISTASKCLAKKEFDLFLIDTLFFCLENYLNNNLLIQVVATKCLETLALNYSNIQELLSLNYDYIMNDLVLKSHKQTRVIRAKQDEETSEQLSHVYVLCSLLDMANSDIVPYIERLIDDYFISIELNSQDHIILNGICNIMLHMSKSMRKWYPVKFNFINNSTGEQYLTDLNLISLMKSKQKTDYNKSFSANLFEIDQSIMNFKTEEQTSMNNTNKTVEELIQENEDELDNKINQEPDSKEVQLHVKLQVKCLQLCTHLISHPYKQIRLSIIDLISELSHNLAEHTNEFLPLVHKLWTPICQRFTLDDLIVKSKIIYLLFDLSVYCTDFLASRFCKEFLPRLCKFMHEQSKISLKSTKISTQSSIGDSTYIYSHAFKLQCSILANISKMCCLFDVKELELEQVLTTSIFQYLDKNQPKKLQLLALASIENCALIDSDIVWLSLHYILPFGLINSSNDSQFVYSKNIKLKYDYQFSDETLDRLVQIFRNI